MDQKKVRLVAAWYQIWLAIHWPYSCRLAKRQNREEKVREREEEKKKEEMTREAQGRENLVSLRLTYLWWAKEYQGKNETHSRSKVTSICADWSGDKKESERERGKNIGRCNRRNPFLLVVRRQHILCLSLTVLMVMNIGHNGKAQAVVLRFARIKSCGGQYSIKVLTQRITWFVWMPLCAGSAMDQLLLKEGWTWIWSSRRVELSRVGESWASTTTTRLQEQNRTRKTKETRPGEGEEEGEEEEEEERMHRIHSPSWLGQVWLGVYHVTPCLPSFGRKSLIEWIDSGKSSAHKDTSKSNSPWVGGRMDRSKWARERSTITTAVNVSCSWITLDWWKSEKERERKVKGKVKEKGKEKARGRMKDAIGAIIPVPRVEKKKEREKDVIEPNEGQGGLQWMHRHEADRMINGHPDWQN